jgi:hypothetical protein
VYTKIVDVPVPVLRKYWTQKMESLNSQCHAITKKYPVQQVHKVLNEYETLAGCRPASVGGSPQWNTIVNSAEENRTNFCKGVNGEPLFSALYGMYAVTLNELKSLNAQTKKKVVRRTKPHRNQRSRKMNSGKQKDARDITPMETQSAKKSTKAIPTSPAVKLPSKAE